jgi:hypothetical protein
MPLHTFLHNLLNVLVQIANKVGLQKKRGGQICSNIFQSFLDIMSIRGNKHFYTFLNPRNFKVALHLSKIPLNLTDFFNSDHHPCGDKCEF